MSPMMALAKKTLILVIGWSFILLGIVGLFLPFLQGFLFLLIGLLILSKESTLAKGLLHRIQARYPVQYKKMHDFNQRLKKKFLNLIKT
ncbi:MAG TPA: PGPGW domain-containing protein [Nitrospiria bacterium]